MTERTFNIVMACKEPVSCNVCDAVKSYMAQECGCDIETYSESTLAPIMLEAMYDYLDTCDKPSIFMREYNSQFKNHLSTAERIARTFRMVQVRDEFSCVNGFGAWMK